MSGTMKITGRVRGMNAGNYPENREEEQFHLNNRGDLLIAQALPERAEIVRMGKSYVAVGTGVAAGTAIPTTAAALCLWNGENDDGYSYIIDYVGQWLSTGASSAAINISMGVQLHLGKQSKPNGTAVTPKSLSGRANYGGKASVLYTNTSLTDYGAGHSIGMAIICALTTNPTLCQEIPVFGRYIVQPGCLFSIQPLCNAANSSASTPYVIWHEARLING